MKKKIGLFLFWLTVVSGCSSNLLVQRLRDHNVRTDNTVALRFVGSEGGYGHDVSVKRQQPELIKSVWARIYSAKPTSFWAACGERKVEFYTKNSGEKPAAVLILHSTDATSLQGDLWYHNDAGRKGYYGLWRCPGLNKLMTWYLKREYLKRKGDTTIVRETSK